MYIDNEWQKHLELRREAMWYIIAGLILAIIVLSIPVIQELL